MLDPNSLFESFGHIGAGKKTKRPVMEAASDHRYESEVEVDVYLKGEGHYSGKSKILWTVDLESRSGGLKNITPIVPEQTLTFTAERDDEQGEPVSLTAEHKISNPEIEILVSEDTIRSLALWPYEVEIYDGKATVRFYGG